MAFNTANLVLWGIGNDKKLFHYYTSDDTLATVFTAGYFNNTDDFIRMVAEDVIFVSASDGDALGKVASVSSGSVTLQAFDNVDPVVAFAGSTSISFPNSGVVTVSPTSAAMGQFKMAAAPVPGQAIKIVNISPTTSASAVIVGATTSTCDFFYGGLSGGKALTLNYGAAVELLPVDTENFYIMTAEHDSGSSTVVNTWGSS